MNTKKQLGIWMDHSSARLMQFPPPSEEKDPENAAPDDDADTEKGESRIHNKEQHQPSRFYKALGEAILDYNEVLLFGPTDAKVELLYLLSADHRFEKISIEVQQSDKLTDNQQQAFVRTYFSKS